MADNNQERARHANNILNNPVFEETFALIKEGLLQAMLACKPDDDDGRWRFSAALRNIELQRRHWEEVLRRGQVTAATVQDIGEDPTVFRKVVRGLF